MKINGYDFLIGADPEFFVAKKGKPVSAHGLVPGDKKNPLPVKKGAVQVDGMALEFNIDPATNFEEFDTNLDTVLEALLEMVPGYEMYNSPVAHFGRKYIEAQPEAAKILGCEPDFNAYTKEPNPTPNVETPFRTASGHIHIGWTKGVDPYDPGHFDACCTLTKMLDMKLGVPSLVWDRDRERRQLYGKAGCFRPKSYGMEYRVLSNAWLNPSQKHLRQFVYQETVEAISDLFANEDAWETKLMGSSAEEIINHSEPEVQEKMVHMACLYSGKVRTPKFYRELYNAKKLEAF